MNEPDFTVTKVKLSNCWSEYERNKGGFSIQWITKSAGFGYVVFYIDNDGVLKCENEGMNKEFILEVMKKLVDNAVLTE